MSLISNILVIVIITFFFGKYKSNTAVWLFILSLFLSGLLSLTKTQSGVFISTAIWILGLFIISEGVSQNSRSTSVSQKRIQLLRKYTTKLALGETLLIVPFIYLF